MQVAVRKSRCAIDAYTSVYENIPVVIHHSTQENVSAGKDRMFCSNMFEHNRAYKISCYSAIGPAWMLGGANLFFKLANLRTKNVREGLLSLEA